MPGATGRCARGGVQAAPPAAAAGPPVNRLPSIHRGMWQLVISALIRSGRSWKRDTSEGRAMGVMRVTATCSQGQRTAALWLALVPLPPPSRHAAACSRGVPAGSVDGSRPLRMPCPDTSHARPLAGASPKTRSAQAAAAGASKRGQGQLSIANDALESQERGGQEARSTTGAREAHPKPAAGAAAAQVVHEAHVRLHQLLQRHPRLNAGGQQRTSRRAANLDAVCTQCMRKNHDGGWVTR